MQKAQEERLTSPGRHPLAQLWEADRREWKAQHGHGTMTSWDLGGVEAARSKAHSVPNTAMCKPTPEKLWLSMHSSRADGQGCKGITREGDLQSPGLISKEFSNYVASYTRGQA